MNESKDANLIEKIDCEIEDDYSDDSLFNIASWGADLSFRELISMYEEDELAKPELQRKYVWSKVEASRFVESILMGLPVPSIFLAQSGSQKLIVDGYQRIMTIHDYVKGVFSGDGKVFRLSNSEKINSRWRNKAFSELDVDDRRRIKSTTIHAIIFEQRKPEKGESSMYQIFERINTGGRTLTPQEIRNCVYQGKLNSLIMELNKNSVWRILFGIETEDSRMRDTECILRFFAIKSDSVMNCKLAQISLKKELNNFMDINSNADDFILEQYRNDFLNMINAVYKYLGKNAFKNYAKGKFIERFHPTIFDAVSIAFFNAIKEGKIIHEIDEKNHIAMLADESFKETISIRTTNIENIKDRIRIASKYLLG